MTKVIFSKSDLLWTNFKYLAFFIRYLKQLKQNAYLTKSNCYVIRITFSYFSFDIEEQL